MSRTKGISKTRFFANNPREPHCSPDVWLVEPFDEEMELWTLGTTYGFVWVLIVADPDAARCRSMPRSEGVAAIRTQLAEDRTHIMFAGSVAGDSLEVELSNLLIGFQRYKAIDVAESASTLVRVCERLKDLQFYDGEARVEQFERDGENGGASIESFWNVLEHALTPGVKR